MSEERKKCNRCSVNLLLKDFKLKRDGLYSKSCFQCLDGIKKNNKKNREKNRDKFKCEECEYKTSDNSHLQDHNKAVHLKIKNHICEYENCEFKCSSNGNLQKHIKQVHLKIKNHICEYENCNYKCSTSSHLQTHIKQIHNRIKDFECDNCNYKCSTNGHLQRHIQICTGTEHISSGEFQVRECLQEMNIDFQHNTSYIVKDIQLLHWDFILYKDDEIKAFIEYDGAQHFIPQRFGGISIEKAEENLRTSQRRDKIKNDFCKENNYPLLRIPYTDYGNIPEMVTEFCVQHLNWGFE